MDCHQTRQRQEILVQGHMGVQLFPNAVLPKGLDGDVGLDDANEVPDSEEGKEVQVMVFCCNAGEFIDQLRRDQGRAEGVSPVGK